MTNVYERLGRKEKARKFADLLCAGKFTAYQVANFGESQWFQLTVAVAVGAGKWKPTIKDVPSELTRDEILQMMREREQCAQEVSR